MDPITIGLLGGAAISAAGSLFGGNRAADAQKDAAGKSIAEQQRQYNNALTMLEPQRALGYGAMSDIASLYGYAIPNYTPLAALDSTASRNLGAPTRVGGLSATLANMIGGPANNLLRSRMVQQQPQQAGVTGQPGNFSRFFASPDYNFRRTEGIRGIEQGAAARGGALGGNALRGVTNYSSNLASGEYADYMNRLFNISGMGQTATSQGVNAGQNYANNYSQAQQNIGDARASGVVTGISGVTNALNSGLNNYLLYRGGYFGTPSYGSGGGYSYGSRGA